MSSQPGTTRSTSATGIRIGVNVPNYGAASSLASLRNWFQRAEETGYDLALVSDHVAITPDVHRRYPAPFSDPFATLAWAGGITSRITLGTTVIVLPYRHPLVTASLATTIDRLSGHRFVLGVGAGWAAQEFRAVGQRVDDAAAVTDEQVRALATLLTREIADHHGERYRFDDVRTGIDPARPIPLWVGGNSLAAARRAASFGTGWHPLDATNARLQAGAARMAEAAGALGRPVPEFAPRITLRPSADPVSDLDRSLGHGTWDQLEADFRQLVALGAGSVVLDAQNTAAEPESAWLVIDRARLLIEQLA